MKLNLRVLTVSYLGFGVMTERDEDHELEKLKNLLIGKNNNRIDDLEILNVIQSLMQDERSISLKNKSGINTISKILSFLNEQTSKDPNFTEAWLIQGTLFYKIERYNRAVEVFDSALRSMSNELVWNKGKHLNYIYALKFKAFSLCRLGRYKEALDALNQILMICPEDSEIQEYKNKLHKLTNKKCVEELNEINVGCSTLLKNLTDCFVSYKLTTQNFGIMENVVIPIVTEFGFKNVYSHTFDEKKSFDFTIGKLRYSKFFLCELTDFPKDVIYELGLAHAWGIPSLILTQDNKSVPIDLASKFPTIVYNTSENGIVDLKIQLRSHLRDYIESPKTLLDPTIKRYIDTQKTISFEFFSKEINPVKAFKSISNILNLLDQIEKLDHMELVEIKSGSLGSWINVDFEAITSLVEKIVFIVPEWRKKDAEGKKILAEADITKAQEKQILDETNRKNIEFLLKIIKCVKDSGLSQLKIDSQLSISNKEGEVEIEFLNPNFLS
jgi:hypothetical protein